MRAASFFTIMFKHRRLTWKSVFIEGVLSWGFRWSFYCPLESTSRLGPLSPEGFHTAPVLPVGPVEVPVTPVTPVGPVTPTAPALPAGPVGPVRPVTPVGPAPKNDGPVGLAPVLPVGPVTLAPVASGPCFPVGPVGPMMFLTLIRSTTVFRMTGIRLSSYVSLVTEFGDRMCSLSNTPTGMVTPY